MRQLGGIWIFRWFIWGRCRTSSRRGALGAKKTKTINLALGTVRHILNLAASEWLDEYRLTWLERMICNSLSFDTSNKFAHRFS